MDKQSRNSLAVQLYDCCREVHEYYDRKVVSSVFIAALAHEMRLRGLRFRTKTIIDIQYKGIHTGQKISVDYIVEDEIVLEICTEMNPLSWHENRLSTILTSTVYSLGILIDPRQQKIIEGFKKIMNSKILSL